MDVHDICPCIKPVREALPSFHSSLPLRPSLHNDKKLTGNGIKTIWLLRLNKKIQKLKDNGFWDDKVQR